MAESKIEDMDLIKVVDKEEVLNDPTTSMKKVEDNETQEVSNKNESELNDSYENALKVVAVIDVKKQESSLDSENSNNIENTVSENEKHTKEDVTMNARLKEMDNEENSKQIENSSLKVKDNKNTISEEEETLNEILKVVHENLGSTEVRQFAAEPKNLKQENKSVNEETKEQTDRESKKEDVIETTNDDTDVLIINESVSSRRNSDTKQSMEIEHMEVGIVGPPTTVSELINEEELRAESALSTDQKVEVHVAEWVQNSAKAEELIGDEEETPINDAQQEKKNVKEKRTRKKKSNDVLNLPSRKSQRIVSNIIKKSIKWWVKL